MMVKITATRREDVLQRKAQYDEELRAYDQRQAISRKNMRAAEKDITEPLKQYFETEFADLDALTFEYRIESDWLGRFDEAEGIRVHIECNEHNKFSDNVALAWSYDVRLNGADEVIRESSSWSGLSATTPEQMKSLEQTVEALKILNNMDWKAIMSVRMPKYSDFYDFSDKGPERQDFRSELTEATIADAIGTDTWIKVYNWDNSPWRGKYVWIHPTKESGSQFTCDVIDNWSIDEYKDPTRNIPGARMYNDSYERRIRKSTLQMTDPEEIIEIPRS